MEIGLAEAMESLRAEVEAAASAGATSGTHFPIVGIQVELQVAVKREAKLSGKAKFWVVEADGSGSLAKDEIHKVVVTLGTPIDAGGAPISITRAMNDKPE